MSIRLTDEERTLVHRHPGEPRAIRLLHRFCTPAQWSDLVQDNHIWAGSRPWEIRYVRNACDCRFCQHGIVSVSGYCVLTDMRKNGEYLPWPDEVLAIKLHIEHRERYFRSRAGA